MPRKGSWALAYLFSEASRSDNLKRKEREDIRVSKSKMVSEPQVIRESYREKRLVSGHIG